MNIYLENVILGSSTGPNHFGAKLARYIKKSGHFCAPSIHPPPDIQLSFIESYQRVQDTPMVQRLDGIYFDVNNCE